MTILAIEESIGRIYHPLPVGSICAYCPELASGWDHVVPLHWGGADHPDNMVPACWPCNRRKGEQPVEVWLLNQAQRKTWLLEHGWMLRRDLPRDPADRHYAIVNGHRFFVHSDSATLFFHPDDGACYLIKAALRLQAFGLTRPTIQRRRYYW